MNAYSVNKFTATSPTVPMETCEKRKGLVTDQLQLLESSIHELGARLKQLAEKIDPILSPMMEPDSVENVKSCPPSVLPSLATVIESRRNAIEAMTRVVVSLNGRIEL